MNVYLWRAGCGMEILQIAVLLLAAASLFASEAKPARFVPAARQDAWKVMGMGGGGTMIFPTISPHDPKVVVEGCDMTGCYITVDGGKSWRMFNLRTGIRCYAFDPSRPNVIYAGNDGLWRSEDTGKTWSLVLPDPAKNTFEHMRGDHADHTFSSGDPGYPGDVTDVSITAVAVDPRDSSAIYVAFNGGYFRRSRPSLVASTDYGKTWRKVRDVEVDEVLQIDVDARTGVVACVTPQGVAALSERRWDEYAAPKGVKFDCVSLGRASDGRVIIYATSGASWNAGKLAGGIYVSADLGKTWRECGGSLPGLVAAGDAGRPPQFHAVAACATRAEIAYVGFKGLPLGRGKEGLYNGIARTGDAGRTWKVVKKESNEPSENAIITWVEPRMREGTWDVWFDSPRDLGVAPSDPDICYATDLFRTYRTTDGGETWETVNSAKVGEDRWTTRGLDVTTCYGVHFDPFNQKNVYISYTDMGMFRSEDGGASWTSSIEGIPNGWRNTTYWLEFDPDVKGLVWGAFSGTHDLPRPKMWRHSDPAGYRGGVATSTDGGKTWTPTSDGIDQGAITHVLLDPTSAAGKRTLYATAFGKGVFKSTDNGKTWALKNNGIDKKQPFTWRMTRADDGTLYLVVARRNEEGQSGQEGDGALYLSTDGAETWRKMTLPQGCSGPNGLTLDPEDKKRIYLPAWGKVTEGAGDTGGGIFLSADGGKTWKHVMKDGQHVYDVTADARNGRLYACGFDSAAYRSTDKGATWTRLKGYTFKWGHRVVPDPADPGMVYVTTFGGSVWYGPAAGDPGAVEDIVTPIGREIR